MINRMWRFVKLIFSCGVVERKKTAKKERKMCGSVSSRVLITAFDDLSIVWLEIYCQNDGNTIVHEATYLLVCIAFNIYILSIKKF